jgi:hypothetical protein
MDSVHLTSNSSDSWFPIFGEILCLGLILYWSYPLLTAPAPWIFLDGVNLIFHEAGHLITYFLGTTISILSGSLFQLIIPLGLLIYFLYHESRFSAAFALFWLGDNLINVGLYIADARAQLLPLIGGQHDWHYLLTQFNLLENDLILGSFAKYLGQASILVSLIIMTCLIVQQTIVKGIKLSS